MGTFLINICRFKYDIEYCMLNSVSYRFLIFVATLQYATSLYESVGSLYYVSGLCICSGALYSL